MQAIELLRHTPNLRMEFSRFVPAYHAHFGRQLRVAHYGCVKLVELFELIPEFVSVCGEPSGERSVRVCPRAARPVLAQRLRVLAPAPLHDLPNSYAKIYGALPMPGMLDAMSVEELIYAAGGCVENGVVLAPGTCPSWSGELLAVCAVLCADRSVARGSTHEYFSAAFRRLRSVEPDLRKLVAAGVVSIVQQEARLQLSNVWRTVWRLAQILSERVAMRAEELYVEYARRHEPVFPGGESGVEGVTEFLNQYSEIFVENEAGWSVCAGVTVARGRELMPGSAHEDYSVYDTPPGQKGSRVFESPRNNIWCSPPASALPAPTALLSQDNRRRIRLAAHFDVS